MAKTQYRVRAGCCAYVLTGSRDLNGGNQPIRRLIYGGDLVPANTPPEDIAHLLDTGLIESVDAPGNPA